MSNIQTAVDIFASRAASDKFPLKETKCKEIRICFSTNGPPDLNLILINDKQIDAVSHAKILGVNISSDLKWNHHISEVVGKLGNACFVFPNWSAQVQVQMSKYSSIGPAFVRWSCNMLARFFTMVYLCIFLMS